MLSNIIKPLALLVIAAHFSVTRGSDFVAFKSTVPQSKHKFQAKETTEPIITVQTRNQSCPTWMSRRSDANQMCVCGDSVHSTVRCDNEQNKTFILDCFCMTHDEQHGAVVGKCFYKCAQSLGDHDFIYYPLPSDPTQLNDQQCGYLNRDGRLCGRCKEGYSPLVYSYDLQCMNCTNSKYNWAKFVAASFVPLTTFYLFVVIFQFRASSPKLYGFFNVTQALSVPAHLRIVLTYSNSNAYHGVGLVTRAFGTIYGIWNLDFFRTLYTNVCLDISSLQILALDYAIAFYPLALIALSVLLIELHIRGFRIIMWLWKPFQHCLRSYKKQWNVKMSMIDVIATFLLLSYVKLLSVSSDLLLYTTVYNINGTEVGKYLYYDATIEYFGKEHLPYALLAIFVSIVFILSPIVLLLLYPMKCFQKLLNYTKLRNQTLGTFIDVFQGCYKDGTQNGQRDCRYFSTMPFILRILFFVIYACTLNNQYYGLAAITLIAVSILYVAFQPYKARFAIYNAVEISMFLLLAMTYMIVTCIANALIKAPQWEKFLFWVGYALITIPLIYITTITVTWLLTHNKVAIKCVIAMKSRRTRSESIEVTVTEEQSNNIDCSQQHNTSTSHLIISVPSDSDYTNPGELDNVVGNDNI